jgi:glycosyltransferase involved in cell wall biosynthesis
MLLGMARLFSRRFGPPVVCSLSGEDVFVEKLPSPYYRQVRDLLRERAGDADAFVALNTYYADFMVDYLDVPRGKIHVIPHGLRLDEQLPRREPRGSRPARIGYLARICHDKGLHLLVEACERLANDRFREPFELHVAGYLGAAERDYFAKLEQRIAKGPIGERYFYHGELDRAAKLAFLSSLDLFSVPTVYRESKGLPVLEALSCGIPVVQPSHGSFVEIVQDTGGGLLCKPHEAIDLAEKLAVLLRDSCYAESLGRTGQQAVFERYHHGAMAERTRQLYQRLVLAGDPP